MRSTRIVNFWFFGSLRRFDLVLGQTSDVRHWRAGSNFFKILFLEFDCYFFFSFLCGISRYNKHTRNSLGKEHVFQSNVKSQLSKKLNGIFEICQTRAEPVSQHKRNSQPSRQTHKQLAKMLLTEPPNKKC